MQLGNQKTQIEKTHPHLEKHHRDTDTIETFVLEMLQRQIAIEVNGLRISQVEVCVWFRFGITYHLGQRNGSATVNR